MTWVQSLSSTLELDAPWSGLNPLEGVGGGASPCFGGSDDSLDSDFTGVHLASPHPHPRAPLFSSALHPDTHSTGVELEL